MIAPIPLLDLISALSAAIQAAMQAKPEGEK